MINCIYFCRAPDSPSSHPHLQGPGGCESSISIFPPVSRCPTARLLPLAPTAAPFQIETPHWDRVRVNPSSLKQEIIKATEIIRTCSSPTGVSKKRKRIDCLRCRQLRLNFSPRITSPTGLSPMGASPSSSPTASIRSTRPQPTRRWLRRICLGLFRLPPRPLLIHWIGSRCSVQSPMERYSWTGSTSGQSFACLQSRLSLSLLHPNVPSRAPEMSTLVYYPETFLLCASGGGV